MNNVELQRKVDCREQNDSMFSSKTLLHRRQITQVYEISVLFKPPVKPKKGTLLHLDDGEVVALGFSYVRNIVLELEAWQVVIDVL